MSGPPDHPLARLLPGTLRAALGRIGAPPDQDRQLAAILGVDPARLDALRLGPEYHYRPGVVAKRDGRTRAIFAPSPALKQLQHRLLKDHLAGLLIHPCATAFHPGASAVRHARAHARSALVATVDLRDFFDTTRAARVRGFFAAQGWRDEPLRALVRLCTFRGGLPQGAPTSPCLSNLVNTRLDERIRRIAARSGAAYTRYADDLAFSWAAGRAMPGDFTRAVEDALGAEGYEVQPSKGWAIRPIAARPVVTGLVLLGDGRLRIPWPLRLQILRLRCQSWWAPDPHTRARLDGLRGYERMVDGLR